MRAWDGYTLLIGEKMKKLVIRCVVSLAVLLLLASVVGCQQQPEPITPSKGPTTLAILVESNTVEVGSSFMVSGSNLKPKQWVFVDFEYRTSNHRVAVAAITEVDEQGSFYLRMKMPGNVVPGNYEVKISAGATIHIKDRQLLTTLPIHVRAAK